MKKFDAEICESLGIDPPISLDEVYNFRAEDIGHELHPFRERYYKFLQTSGKMKSEDWIDLIVTYSCMVTILCELIN